MNTRIPPMSERTNWDRRASRLSELMAEASARGQEWLDLTESNPTRCGLRAPAELLGKLGDARGASYAPSPLGMPEARAAVAGYYHERGLPADPERIVLSTSTSEAYGWLFKLLCDPGDELLVPQPSYPLLPLLAALEGVRLVPYPLLRDEAWRVDMGAVARALGPRTRGILLVSPNNPTGSLVHRDDALALEGLAAERGLALVADEVFGDFLQGPLRADRRASFAGTTSALCFVLSGLSKLALLPQVKLGWIACHGPEAATREALARLELVADSYLSVSTAVQLAAPGLLGAAAELRRPVLARLTRNLDAIDQAIAANGASCPVRRVPSEAGWSSMLEVPRTRSDDDWLERLVLGEGLVVHPGYLFDVDAPGTMVVSLLLEPERFEPAIRRAVAVWSAG
jgi:alanine-synthesizing transaminase